MRKAHQHKYADGVAVVVPTTESNRKALAAASASTTKRARDAAGTAFLN